MEKPNASERMQDARTDRLRPIAPPSRHEGIGNALRAAYDPGGYALPAEFSNLLAKIDR